jgi:hypothetical protein
VKEGTVIGRERATGLVEIADFCPSISRGSADLM